METSGVMLPIQVLSPLSKNTNRYWFWALNTKQTTPESSTLNSGKFLIFEPRQYIEESWKIIKTATEAGKLGRIAKVSTRKKSADVIVKKDHHVICVYANDSDDEVEKERIRESLYRLGYSEHLPYKTDADTLKGIYTDKSGRANYIRKSDLPKNEAKESVGKSTFSSSKQIKNEDGKSDLAENFIPASLVRRRNIYPLPEDWKPIKYIQIYTTSSFPYSTNRYIHIRQTYPAPTDTNGKTIDIIFPLEEFKEVSDSLYKLGRTFIENEDKILYGLKTSYIEMSVGFFDELSEPSICFHSRKTNVNVFLPQTNFLFYYNIMERLRKWEYYNDPEYKDHGITTDEDNDYSDSEESDFELE